SAGVNSNPTPILREISPTAITAANNTAVVTLHGINFTSASVVKIGPVPVSTVFMSCDTLTATIPSSAFSSAGNFEVTVTNPGPGGGVSASRTLTVNSLSRNQPPT